MNLLQPFTQQGNTQNLTQWIPLADMATTATATLDSATGTINNFIDRIEARPEKGMVKVLFKEGH